MIELNHLLVLRACYCCLFYISQVYCYKVLLPFFSVVVDMHKTLIFYLFISTFYTLNVWPFSLVYSACHGINFKIFKYVINILTNKVGVQIMLVKILNLFWPLGLASSCEVINGKVASKYDILIFRRRTLQKNSFP